MALVAALEASPLVRDVLAADADVPGRPAVFDTEAPTGQSAPYLTIGDASEQRTDTYGGAGHVGGVFVHIWTDEPGRERAATVEAAIRHAIDGVPLPVDGHTPARGWVALAASLRDPVRGHHRVLRYTPRTRVVRATAPVTP